jgi:small subunit ribosomal protein S16
VLRIRLRRTGAKKQPRYRVVVAESSAPRDGAYVEVLGWYNPQAEPSQVHVNAEKAAHWIGRGAQPSGRVAYLLKRAALGPAAEPPPTDASAAEELVDKAPARRRAARKTEASAAEAPETQAAAETPPQRRRTTRKKEASPSAAETPASEAPESEGSAASSEA